MALFIDGTPLDDPAGRWSVNADSRVRIPPPAVINDVTIPGAHGTIPALTSPFAAGGCTLVMDIKGADYGAVLASSFNALNRLIAPRRTLRTLLEQGTGYAYTAQARYVSASELALIGDTDGQVTYTMSIPSGFWRDQAATTVDLGTGAGTMTPAALQGGSAPIVDPVWVAVGNGAATDFKVTDVESGTWLRWAGTVPAGQSVRVEPRTPSAFLVASASPWSGGTDASGLLTLGPGQFVLTENVAFTIAKTGATGTQVRAQRAYL